MWAIQMATDTYKFTDIDSDKATNQMKQENPDDCGEEEEDDDDF